MVLKRLVLDVVKDDKQGSLHLWLRSGSVSECITSWAPFSLTQPFLLTTVHTRQ